MGRTSTPPRPRPAAETIADGIAVREPVPYALATMRGVVDEVVSVTDADIVRAMRLVHEHLGIVVEPAGAAGLAALLADAARWRGTLVATPLCGGNATPAGARDSPLGRCHSTAAAPTCLTPVGPSRP